MKSPYIFFVGIVAVCLLFTACKKEPVQPDPVPTWQVDNTGKYASTMTAVVRPENVYVAALSTNDKLGAFINGECRGLGELKEVGQEKVFFVMINGLATEGSSVSFKYYNAGRQKLTAADNVINFVADGNFGTADNPQLISFK